MESYTINSAQEHLKELLAAAHQGKTVVIIDADNQAVQLVPVPSQTKPERRKAGSARGQIHMADDFDTPLVDFDEYMP